MCFIEQIDLKFGRLIQPIIVYLFYEKYFVKSRKKLVFFILIGITNFAHPERFIKVGWFFFPSFSYLGSGNL